MTKVLSFAPSVFLECWAPLAGSLSPPLAEATSGLAGVRGVVIPAAPGMLLLVLLLALSSREDGIRTADTNQVISTERSSHSSFGQVFVFVFTQPGDCLHTTHTQNAKPALGRSERSKGDFTCAVPTAQVL